MTEEPSAEVSPAKTNTFIRWFFISLIFTGSAVLYNTMTSSLLSPFGDSVRQIYIHAFLSAMAIVSSLRRMKSDIGWIKYSGAVLLLYGSLYLP